ncbi:helix-turn-helix domain-containing protein [Culturomica massiliensis]|uniref:helix-turn-helix domain-containing protein n=1 Tax=Culturomica massiliensis TaxID=1841857 RepID=UPI003F5BC0D9
MREVHGYTQEALSYALGFERTFINKYERGLRCYNYNHLNALAKIFKCSPRDFLPENPISLIPQHYYKIFFLST